ncbi:MAG: hypothetical protein K2N30_00150, partial [Clostridia bacterium]|nr:hypothetical protein [Clostridia bacterium]
DMDVFIQQYGGELSDDILETIKEINEIIKNVSNDKVAPEDDAVRLSVENFLADMLAVEENYESYSYDALQSEIRTNVNSYKDELITALLPQSGRCLADEFIRRRAAQIFDIDANELPRQNSGVQELDENPDDKDPDDNNNGGGIGRDDAVYGSSEYIYDPDTGELTVYGAVFNQYYASMTEQLFNGSIPENLQESIKKYFDVLYSGTLPKEDNENKEE